MVFMGQVADVFNVFQYKILYWLQQLFLLIPFFVCFSSITFRSHVNPIEVHCA